MFLVKMKSNVESKVLICILFNVLIIHASQVCVNPQNSVNKVENRDQNLRPIEFNYYNDSKPEKQHKISDNEDIVKVELFYESLCPGCRHFYTHSLQPVVVKLNNKIKLETYPYGNAETIEIEGKYVFKCQHGPVECYGNMLHACAIDILGNSTAIVLHNACLMDLSQPGYGSDDAANKVCGEKYHENYEEIQKCAHGPRGRELLKMFGEVSKAVGFPYVPYVLINGQENNRENFMRDVCAAFKIPPPECS